MVANEQKASLLNDEISKSRKITDGMQNLYSYSIHVNATKILTTELSAIKKYKEAIVLNLQASKPSRNLSATWFEARKYKLRIASAEKAIELITAEGGLDAAAQIQKLKGRISKARANIPEISEEEQWWTRLKILETNPRYRISIQVIHRIWRRMLCWPLPGTIR